MSGKTFPTVAELRRALDPIVAERGFARTRSNTWARHDGDVLRSLELRSSGRPGHLRSVFFEWGIDLSPGLSPATKPWKMQVVGRADVLGASGPTQSWWVLGCAQHDEFTYMEGEAERVGRLLAEWLTDLATSDEVNALIDDRTSGYIRGRLPSGVLLASS